ncbi:MAG: hypothetical protein SFU91_03160 [Chloroherpetonaceae bacterium]|nr:hypothetical protein [Chloroherpetonaceae bacterium]
MTKEESKIFGSYSPKVSYTEALSTIERSVEECMKVRGKELSDEAIPESEIQKTVFQESFVTKNRISESVNSRISKEPNELERNSEKPVAQKRMSQRAQERIESVLTLQTFVIVIFSAICIGLYIYNVISINRLSGESEELKENLEKAKSLNVELESKIKQAERGERIMSEAYQKLGLRYNINPPVVISRE